VARYLTRLAAPLCVLAAFLGLASAASAAQRVINSAGPLTSIYLNDDLACQARHSGDTSNEFFGGTDPGSCGTFIRAGGVTYGPSVGPSPTAYTLVSQSPVTGTGTAANPFKVVTVVNAGSTGLRLTQTDTYVVGLEAYRTDITVRNTSSSPVTAELYHAADCYLQNDDDGFGWRDPATGGIFCTKNANNSPPARILGFDPISGGNSFQEDYYGSIWDVVDTGTPFGNFCACTTLQDNGAGVSWSLNLPATGVTTRSLNTVFSPTGDATGSGGGGGGGGTGTGTGTGTAPTATAGVAPPVAGKSFDASPAGGKVYFKCRGHSRQRLTGGVNLPVGCLVDARKGKVKIISAANGSSTKTKSAIFYEGQFKVREKRSSKPVTELRLAGKLAGCSHKSAKSSDVRDARRRRRGRRLWGRGRGRFRSRGRRSAASVRGTTWFVQDRCDGSTLTKVRKGKVKVRDFVKHKTITLKKGQSYVAKPRKRR
jgi:hypothetical protein